MKLIIDIPEVYYEALAKTEEIISSQRSGKTFMSTIYSAVAHGIPLDDVKAEIEEMRIKFMEQGEYMSIVHTVLITQLRFLTTRQKVRNDRPYYIVERVEHFEICGIVGDKGRK